MFSNIYLWHSVQSWGYNC